MPVEPARDRARDGGSFNPPPGSGCRRPGMLPLVKHLACCCGCVGHRTPLGQHPAPATDESMRTTTWRGKAGRPPVADHVRNRVRPLIVRTASEPKGQDRQKRWLTTRHAAALNDLYPVAPVRIVRHIPRRCPVCRLFCWWWGRQQPHRGRAARSALSPEGSPLAALPV